MSGQIVTCEIDGTASVRKVLDMGVRGLTADGGFRLEWVEADPEIHVTREWVDDDPEAKAFLETRYRIGEWCEDRQAYHAALLPVEGSSSVVETMGELIRNVKSRQDARESRGGPQP